MLKAFIVASVVVLVTAWAVSSRSAPPPSLPPTITPIDELGPEPITGKPVMPKPGAPSAAPHPFEQPVPDPKAWKYEDLTPKEREVVDRGRDTEAWRDVHAAYESAILERLPQIQAQAAASQVGVHDLATIGVVP